MKAAGLTPVRDKIARTAPVTGHRVIPTGKRVSEDLPATFEPILEQTTPFDTVALSNDKTLREQICKQNTKPFAAG